LFHLFASMAKVARQPGGGPSAPPAGVSFEFATGVPDEVVMSLVQQYIDSSVWSYCQMSQVCKAWLKTFSNDNQWNQEWNRRFAQRPTDCDAATWRQRYANAHTIERKFASGSFDFRSADPRGSTVYNLTTVGGKCLAACGDGVIAYDLAGLSRCTDVKPVVRFTVDNDDLAGAALCCLPTAGGGVVAGFQQGGLAYWNAGDELGVCWEAHTKGVKAVALLGNGILSGSADHGVKLWDLSGSSPVCTAHLPDIMGGVTAISPIMGTDSMAVISCRKGARVWDFRAPGGTAVVASLRTDDWCLCVEASRTDSNVVRCSDKAVHTWDLRTKTRIHEPLHRHERLIAQFKTDGGYRLVSCGLNGQVKTSSLEGVELARVMPGRGRSRSLDTHLSSGKYGKLLCHQEDYVLTVDFDETRVVVGGLEGKVEIFECTAEVPVAKRHRAS